ncbi:hypothetical protein Tco_1388992 [Tanacetum coccineum]
MNTFFMTLLIVTPDDVINGFITDRYQIRSEWDSSGGYLRFNFIITEADKKERRLEGEDLGKEEGGPTRVTWMGMVTWREMREEGVNGDGDEERAFFKELVRWRKVSLDDWGSWWDCWERKESRPRIGVEVTVVIRRSMVVKMVIVVILGVS